MKSSAAVSFFIQKHMQKERKSEEPVWGSVVFLVSIVWTIRPYRNLSLMLSLHNIILSFPFVTSVT